MSELAYTVNGDAFDVPATVKEWRVKLLKPRGAPGLVYGNDGRPLTVPVEADLEDFHEAVNAPGKYRLDPIGEDGKCLEDVPAAYIQVSRGERNAAGEQPVERSHAHVDSTLAGLGQAVIEAVRLNAEALKQNAEISMRAVDRLPQLMEAMTTMLNVATGTGLYAVQQRELAQSNHRNAANSNVDDEDDDDDDEDDGDDAPTSIGGFPLPPGLDLNKIVAQVASDVVTKLIEKFSGNGKMSLGSVLDMRTAYAEGQREREAQATVAPTPVAPQATAPTPPATAPAPATVPTDAASMAHFLAVKNALSREEQMLVVALAGELSQADQAAWFSQLRSLGVADAVATVRATLAQLQTSKQPATSLTQPPARSAPANDTEATMAKDKRTS